MTEEEKGLKPYEIKVVVVAPTEFGGYAWLPEDEEEALKIYEDYLKSNFEQYDILHFKKSDEDISPDNAEYFAFGERTIN